MALTDNELQSAYDAATTPEEIKALMLNSINSQPEAVVEPEPNESKVEEGTGGQVYFDDIVIGGKTYHFEGADAGDVLRQIKAATTSYNDAINPVVEEKKTTGITSDEKISLELDYRLGKIGLDEYLDKSGALDTYLSKKGLKVDELQQIVSEKINKKEEGAWASATSEFLAANADWPASDQNTKVMALKLSELNLQTNPSLDSLNQAYASMKKEGLLFPASVAEGTQVKKKLAGSSVFGVSGGAGRDRAPVKGTGAPKITEDMDPREIMELYKQAAQENGQNPDGLFLQTHGRR